MVCSREAGPLKIATFNINKRLHNLMAWLATAQPDVVCLQELKVEQRAFPARALRDLGYVHGKTIIIDYLVAEGRSEKFPELAAECVRLKANIIVVSTTPAAHAAKNTTRTTPIVMVALGDPVGTGLVESLA